MSLHIPCTHLPTLALGVRPNPLMSTAQRSLMMSPYKLGMHRTSNWVGRNGKRVSGEMGNLYDSVTFRPSSVVRVTATAFKMPFLPHNGVFQSFLARWHTFFANASIVNAFLEFLLFLPTLYPLTNVCTGCETQSSDESGTKVADDVSVQVGHAQDIKLCGVAH
jgi:hypothetical protein